MKYQSHKVQSHDLGGRHVAQSAGDKCQGLVGTLGIRKSRIKVTRGTHSASVTSIVMSTCHVTPELHPPGISCFSHQQTCRKRRRMRS
jgi:hypothetical protein